MNSQSKSQELLQAEIRRWKARIDYADRKLSALLETVIRLTDVDNQRRGITLDVFNDWATKTAQSVAYNQDGDDIFDRLTSGVITLIDDMREAYERSNPPR